MIEGFTKHVLCTKCGSIGSRTKDNNDDYCYRCGGKIIETEYPNINDTGKITKAEFLTREEMDFIIKLIDRIDVINNLSRSEWAKRFLEAYMMKIIPGTLWESKENVKNT